MDSPHHDSLFFTASSITCASKSFIFFRNKSVSTLAYSEFGKFNEIVYLPSLSCVFWSTKSLIPQVIIGGVVICKERFVVGLIIVSALPPTLLAFGTVYLIAEGFHSEKLVVILVADIVVVDNCVSNITFSIYFEINFFQIDNFFQKYIIFTT